MQSGISHGLVEKGLVTVSGTIPGTEVGSGGSSTNKFELDAVACARVRRDVR